MLKKTLVAASLLLSIPAFAQNVQYVTPVTRNHIPVWNTNGVIADGGSSADSPISSIGITNNGSCGLGINTARQATGNYEQLCLGVTAAGAATISLQNFGTAPTGTLSFVINGVSYSFPGSLANITVGTTPVIGGTTGQCLYVSGGVVGQQTCTLSAITSLTGDVTATGPGISTATLAASGVTAGTYGSSTLTPIITVDAKGRITSVTTTPAGITVGSTVITSGITNGLLYANGSVLGNLATLASGILITSAGGVPSIATTLPSGLSIPSPTFTGTETFPDSATWTSSGISKVAALSVGSATLPSGGNVSISGQYQINGTQIAASNLSNGATGSGAVVLAASPAISGTWTGNAGFSGNITFSGQAIHSGTSAPASAGGNSVVMGTTASPTLSNTGQAFLYNTVVNGGILQGDGSTNDVSIFNKSGTLVVGVPTGTTKLNFPSLSAGTCSGGLALDSGNNLIIDSCPGASASIQVGTTNITSGSNGNIEFNNSGILGEVTPGNGVGIVSTTLGLTAARRTLPTSCVILSTAATTCSNGGSQANNGTYTTPANVLWIEVTVTGGGGGGGAGCTGGNSGSAGTASTFGSALLTASAGTASAGAVAAGAAGGSASGGYDNITGGTGGNGTSTGLSTTYTAIGGYGGVGIWGGSGSGGTTNIAGAITGLANTGAGGGGGGCNVTGQIAAGGGGAGGTVRAIINSPSATYSYAVGPGGAGGTIGTGSQIGAAGGSGKIVVIEHYGS